jgi:murein DD-endopeptidase MepM/ murein hydrolase activator NlpD
MPSKIFLRHKVTITAFAIAFLQLMSCSDEKSLIAPAATAGDAGKPQGRAGSPFYGIDTALYTVEKGHIRPNRFLSDILSEYGISAKDADLISKQNKEIFDVRDIRAWNNYMVFISRDSIRKARYFVYDHDPVNSYVFSFTDSLKIIPYKRKVEKRIRHSEGTVNTSLWDAMAEAGANQSLAIDLSDIYAWSIDFFALQKGDSFSVIYEEEFVEGIPFNIGRILCARFTHAGVPITAIPMIQDGKESFYDPEGNSLRKAFLKAPLKYSRIASGFSSARMHPILRIVRPHHGVDYAAAVGTPVYTIGDGTITSAGYEDQSGRIVRIRHNSVYSTAYLHLQGFANGIKAGAYVKQGDVIGYVGSSGLSTGPHLDFRVYMNGYAVNPLNIEAPPVEPVKEENKMKFEKLSKVSLVLLESFKGLTF